MKAGPGKVLEIGIGNGFISRYLKEKGLDITTLDIDEKLHPDFVGDVINIPFRDDSFDVIACYEVLEHLSYGDFRRALKEILRVSRKWAVISLPDITRACFFCVGIFEYFATAKTGKIEQVAALPRFRKPVRANCDKHLWEVGMKGYPLSRIIRDIKEAGFGIKKTYRVVENPYHRFFVLEKRNK